MHMSPSDDQLMERVKARDSSAFETLFDRHSSAVYGYCMRTLAGNHALAEDISQTVWLKAVSHAGSYTAKGSFKAWLMTITRNETITQIRKQLPLEKDPDSDRLDPASDFDLEGTVLKTADVAEVRAAIEALPAAQRAVLSLW